MRVQQSHLHAKRRRRGLGNRLCAACALSLVFSLCASCAPSAESQEFVAYDDPDGRFSISIPEGWQIDPMPSDYELFAREAVGGDAPHFEATLALTWGPLPCDRLMVQDAVNWYADLICWGADIVEHSRTETEVDGRRALLVDWSRTMADGNATRQLSLLMEAYGIVWQATCSAPEGRVFTSSEGTFREMLRSLVVHGAWQGIPAG